MATDSQPRVVGQGECKDDRHDPRTAPGRDNSETRIRVGPGSGCSICGAIGCVLTAHRIERLQLMRRLSKAYKHTQNPKGTRKKAVKSAKDFKLQRKVQGQPEDLSGATLGSYKYQKILAKPTLKQARCLACQSTSCTLISHKQYTAALLATASEELEPADDAPHHSHLCLFLAKNPKEAVREAMTPCLSDPSLQLPDNMNDPLSKQLFYDFFTVKSELVTEKQRTSLAFARETNSSLLAQALTDDALCMSLISLSMAFSLDRRAQAGLELTAQSLQMFNKACQLISYKIKNGPGESTLVAALAMTVAQGTFTGNRDAIRAHLQGAHGIIISLGGVTRIRGALLRLFHDIVWAAALLDVNLAHDIQDQVSAITLQDPPELLYGSAFHELADCIDPKLLSVCVDTCRLTELLEDQTLALANARSPNQSRWTYFHYLRDASLVRLVQLHAKHKNSNSIDECIGLTINLYVLSVLIVCPYRMPQIRVCARIQCILKLDGWSVTTESMNSRYTVASTTVSANILCPIRLWILFVTSNALQQIGQTLDGCILDLLLRELTAYFRCTYEGWPDDWRERQLASLKSFCWSEVFLTKRYQITCDLIVAQMAQEHGPPR